jgi:hypothetical protein
MLLRLDGHLAAHPHTVCLSPLITTLQAKCTEQLAELHHDPEEASASAQQGHVNDTYLTARCLQTASALCKLDADSTALQQMLRQSHTLSDSILAGLDAREQDGEVSIHQVLDSVAALHDAVAGAGEADAAHGAKKRRVASGGMWQSATAEAALLNACAHATHHLAIIAMAVLDEQDRKRSAAAERKAALAEAPEGANASQQSSSISDADLEELATQAEAASEPVWRALLHLLERFVRFCVASVDEPAQASALQAGASAFSQAVTIAINVICRGAQQPAGMLGQMN